nr:F-box/FBD/LRR-repeat protein At1g13570-like [Tanacetum cinerariifolium]
MRYLYIGEICFIHKYGLPLLALLMRSSPKLEKLKLVHLKELEIENMIYRETELDFVKFVLAKSPVLKKVRLFLHEEVGKDEHMQTLLDSPRASLEIGNGTDTRFWTDNWVGGGPLKLSFSRLYRLDTNQQCVVSDRAPTFHQHHARTSDRTVTPTIDSQIGPSASQVGRVYNWTYENAPLTTQEHSLCKVNILTWRIVNLMLPTRVNLDYRDLDSIRCPIRDAAIETENHVGDFSVISDHLEVANGSVQVGLGHGSNGYLVERVMDQMGHALRTGQMGHGSNGSGRPTEL